MHRFFVTPNSIDQDRVILSGDVARQISIVLKISAGDSIIVLDGLGWEYIVLVESVSVSQISGRVINKILSIGEPNIDITLYQAVLKGDTFEYVLQKGTELGVCEFVPVFCTRSVPKFTGKDWITRRSKRWEKIILEAAEQSHRGKVPVLRTPVDFQRVCETVDGLVLIPWEEENGTGLKEILVVSKNGYIPKIGVIIGPEGGFTSKEIQLAVSNGIIPVSLGKRIFRADTAAMVAISAILYEFEELGI